MISSQVNYSLPRFPRVKKDKSPRWIIRIPQLYKMLPAYHVVSYKSRQELWYCGPALYSGNAHNFLSTLTFNATLAAICLKKRQWEQRFQRKSINSTMRSSACSAKRKPRSWNSIYETATMTAARHNSTRCRLIRRDGLKHQSTLFTPRTKFLFCVRFC